MAEIKIEKKTNIWPWIIGLLVLAAILYFVFRSNDGEESVATEIAPVENLESEATGANVDAVADYIQYVESGANMGLDHTYTSQALEKLSSAVQAKANQQGVDVTADLTKVNEFANQITQDPFETSHADKIRNAAEILGNSMQTIQQAKYPNLGNAVTEVKQAAGNIKPSELTLDQKDAVKGFFGKSADLLRQMN